MNFVCPAPYAPENELPAEIKAYCALWCQRVKERIAQHADELDFLPGHLGPLRPLRPLRPLCKLDVAGPEERSSLGACTVPGASGGADGFRKVGGSPDCFGGVVMGLFLFVVRARVGAC